MRVRSVVTFAVAVLAPLVVACGGKSPCDEAVDKAKQCGFSDAMLTSAGSACEGASICQAECVNAGTCGEVQDALRTQSGKVFDCARACK